MYTLEPTSCTGRLDRTLKEYCGSDIHSFMCSSRLSSFSARHRLQEASVSTDRLAVNQHPRLEAVRINNLCILKQNT